MLHSRLAVIVIAAFAVLSAAAAPQVLAQLPELENIEPVCIQACVLGRADVPPECDCLEVEAAIDKAADNSRLFSGGPSRGRVPTALDLIAEVEADYQARMASVDNYYFVQRVAIELPPELVGREQRPTAPRMLFAAYTPAAAQSPDMSDVMEVARPFVRAFVSRQEAAGEKAYTELSEAEKHARDPSNAQAPGIAGLAGAINALSGGGAQLLAGRLQEMVASFGGMGDGGLGMKVEKEIKEEVQNRPDLPVYLGWMHNDGFTPVGPGNNPRDFSQACISPACGTDLVEAKQKFAGASYVQGLFEQTASVYGEDLLIQPAYVIRKEGSDEPGDPDDPNDPNNYNHFVEFGNQIYFQKSAELWYIDATEPSWTENGPSMNDLVPVRKRMEYWVEEGNGEEKIIIDVVTDRYGPDPILAPKRNTLTVEGMGSAGAAKITTHISRVTVNAGVPTILEEVEIITDEQGNPLPQ